MLQLLPHRKVAQVMGLGEVKIYADGAGLEDFRRLYAEGFVTGFTTNPTLMRQAKVPDYTAFARALLDEIVDLPISFEVLSDELDEIERQARLIASWGDNVYVKVPITNTRGQSCLPVVRQLSAERVKINVTAILTLEQVAEAVDALHPATPGIVSVFAGRIADTGVDPVPVMRAAVAMAARRPKTEVLWASVREVLNLYQARDCGCHIVTATPEHLAKLKLAGKDLRQFSLETVAMFYRDAVEAGYKL